MQTKKILLISGIVVVAAALAVVLYVSLSKKPAPVAQQSGTSSTTGTGQVSSGGPQISVINPVVDQTNPYSTTKPRVNAPPSSSSGNNNPITSGGSSSGSSSGTGSTNTAVAYNYNQSDSGFLSQYYPDMNQVINGDNGPAGNAQDDPTDQILFNTGGYDGATGNSYVLEPVSGFNTNTLHVSQDNSAANQSQYLNNVLNDTSSFDLVNNINLVTDSLQSQNTGTAKSNLTQATATLNKLEKETVPSDLVPVQESYIDEYQKYITFTQQMESFDNLSSAGQIPNAENNLTNSLNNLSASIQTAASNMQVSTDYLSNASGSGNLDIGNTMVAGPSGSAPSANNTMQKSLIGGGSAQ